MSENFDRLDLNSPRWDTHEFSSDCDLRSVWTKIYELPSDQRNDLMLLLLERTEYVNHPTIAFHFASPYLVDNFTSNFEENWPAFLVYCGFLHYAFNGPTGPCLDQIWNDRDRISQLMIRGLKHLECIEQSVEDRRDSFRLFIAGISTVFGNECLGFHILTDPE